VTYGLEDDQEWRIVRNCTEGGNSLSVLALNGQDQKHHAEPQDCQYYGS